MNIIKILILTLKIINETETKEKQMHLMSLLPFNPISNYLLPFVKVFFAAIGRKQQLELDMEQWTGSKLGKEYVKAVYCHPVYLTYMQSTSCETLDWKKHKLESRPL